MPIKLRTVPLAQVRVYHFKNAAARRAAIAAGFREGEDLNVAVQEKRVDMKIVRPVLMTVVTSAFQPGPDRGTFKAASLPLGQKSADEGEFAFLVASAAAITHGNGFRTPSTKEKNWRSTSLVELAAIAAGQMERNKQTRSKRGEKKLEADAEMKAAIARERIEGIPLEYLSSAARRRLQAAQMPLAAE